MNDQPLAPPTCTATIRWGGRAEEALIRCAQPVGHYDETRMPDPYATPDSPGGWHRSTPPDVATWADRADGATPHRTIPDAASQPRTTPDNPAASGDTADNPPWTWAQAISTHGLGDTFTVDIDAEHPGGDRLTVEVPVVEARTFHSMLGDALGYSDLGSEFVRQIDHPDWDGAEAALGAGTCPGVDLNPNPSTCSCEGCRHHCGAHQPVAARRTLTDLREQYAAAIREVCGEGPWEVIVQRSTDAIMAIRDDDMDAPEDEMERRGRAITGLQAQLQKAQAALPDRAQAAIRAAEQQVVVRDRTIARLTALCQAGVTAGAISVNDLRAALGMPTAGPEATQ